MTSARMQGGPNIGFPFPSSKHACPRAQGDPRDIFNAFFGESNPFGGGGGGGAGGGGQRMQFGGMGGGGVGGAESDWPPEMHAYRCTCMQSALHMEPAGSMC